MTAKNITARETDFPIHPLKACGEETNTDKGYPESRCTVPSKLNVSLVRISVGQAANHPFQKGCKILPSPICKSSFWQMDSNPKGGKPSFEFVLLPGPPGKIVEGGLYIKRKCFSAGVIKDRLRGRGSVARGRPFGANYRLGRGGFYGPFEKDDSPPARQTFGQARHVTWEEEEEEEDGGRVRR